MHPECQAPCFCALQRCWYLCALCPNLPAPCLPPAPRAHCPCRCWLRTRTTSPAHRSHRRHPLLETGVQSEPRQHGTRKRIWPLPPAQATAGSDPSAHTSFKSPVSTVGLGLSPGRVVHTPSPVPPLGSLAFQTSASISHPSPWARIWGDWPGPAYAAEGSHSITSDLIRPRGHPQPSQQSALCWSYHFCLYLSWPPSATSHWLGQYHKQRAHPLALLWKQWLGGRARH